MCLGNKDTRRKSQRRGALVRVKSIKGGDSSIASKTAVTYCNANHLSVMTQLYGSVWPTVLPFCLANTTICAMLWIIDKKYDSIDFSIDPSGHKYISTLVSFLCIARVRLIYGYSIKARENLSVMTQYVHDLVELSTAMTCNDKSLEAREWRMNVALGAIIFLKDCMEALSYNSELTPSQMTEEQKVLRERFFRKPTFSALALKKKITAHRTEFGTLVNRPVVELKLLGYVDTCQSAFYKIHSLLNTPFPFPLLQMGRTILLFWMFTLPLALLHFKYNLWGISMLIFLLTYGFFGLETVCIELSDPFGDDANDFDQIKIARITFEDIFLTVSRNCSEDEISKLRMKANDILDESQYFGANTWCEVKAAPRVYGHG